MTHPASATAIGEIFSTIIDGGDYGEIDRYLTSDYIDHSAVGDLHGREAFAGMLEGFRAAMPGFRHDVSDLTLIGDEMAVWQVHLVASFTGEFMGTRGAGQPVEVWVANAARFAEDGRIREHWGLGQDGLNQMLAQMGIEAASNAPAR